MFINIRARLPEEAVEHPPKALAPIPWHTALWGLRLVPPSSERDPHEAQAQESWVWLARLLAWCHPPSGQPSSPPSLPAVLRSFGGPRRSPGGRRRSPRAAVPAGAPAEPPSSGLGGQARQASAPAWLAVGQGPLGPAGQRAWQDSPPRSRFLRFPLPPPNPASPYPGLPWPGPPDPARCTHHGWPGAPPAGGTGRLPPAVARCSGPWP